MGFAVSLRSDHPSAQSIQSLWKAVERFEDKPSMTELGYPPHVTLAIYDDPAVTIDLMRDVMGRVSSNLTAVTLTFDTLRHFEGPPLVLWASPRPNPDVLSIHDAVHRLVDPLFCRPHYRPGAWTPHCTLGTRIGSEQRAAALAFSSGFRGSFEVVFDGLDCISFPPLAAVDLRKLPWSAEPPQPSIALAPDTFSPKGRRARPASLN